MADTAEETEFAIGDLVHDSEDDDPNDAIVVNTPDTLAQEWHAHNGKSVAEDNPDYPADAQIIVVAFADILREAFPDWEGNTPIPLTDINASEATHYAFPAPRLRISDSNGAANASANDGESTAARSDIATSTASEETEPPTESAQAPASDADGSQDDAAATAAECSASIRALKERLEEGGMTVEIETDGQALQATKLGDTYRVRPGEIIDGDGALRSQLEPIVEEFA